MFKNAAKTAEQYRSGLMATSYENYYKEAIKTLAEKIDQEAMRVYADISKREAAVAHLPTEQSKQATRRLLDAAFGSSAVVPDFTSVSYAEYKKWRDAQEMT